MLAYNHDKGNHYFLIMKYKSKNISKKDFKLLFSDRSDDSIWFNLSEKN